MRFPATLGLSPDVDARRMAKALLEQTKGDRRQAQKIAVQQAFRSFQSGLWERVALGFARGDF